MARTVCTARRTGTPRRRQAAPTAAEPAAALSRRADTTLTEQLTGRYAERIAPAPARARARGCPRCASAPAATR